MMTDANREIFKFDVPTQELGLSDLIKKHKEGDRFQYLAITGKEEESFAARQRRIFTLKPKLVRQPIPSDELPEIELTRDTEDLNLSSILPKKGEKYIRVVNITGYFSPLVSSLSVFSGAKVSLVDSRYDPPQQIQATRINTNLDTKFELSMDFYIPRTSAHRISLVIVREQALISYGEQWGAIQAQVQISEASFPQQHPVKEAVAVVAPTNTLLNEFETDPNYIDIMMTEGDRSKIRELYLQGDIADEDDPIKVRKKAIQYSKSSIRQLDKGAKVESNEIARPGWEHLIGSRKPQIEAELASISVPSGDDEEDEPISHIQTLEQWKKTQEEARSKAFDLMSESTVEIDRPDFQPQHNNRNFSGSTAMSIEDAMMQSVMNNSDSPKGKQPLKPARKGVSFGPSGV